MATPSIPSITAKVSRVINMTSNQLLHLRIDNMVQLMPISMYPVQFWWCEDWIFVSENKNLVTALPDPH